METFLLPFRLSTIFRCKPPETSCFHRKSHPKKTTPLLLRNTSHFRLHSTAPTSSSSSITTFDEDTVKITDEEEEEEKFDWFSHWYPLSPVCDLDKSVPHAKKVLGLDVVMWWDRVEGKWRVFEDSCPHRLAPLSEGRIDGLGRLQCVYHGWCFNGKGSCELIPQSPRDGPPIHTNKKACVSVYPSSEQNKILWFWPNSDPKFKDISLTKKPPFIQELDDPSFTSMMGIRDIPYGYEVLIENLMDPSHVPYAHYGIMRIPRNNAVKVDREGGRPLDITVQTMDNSGFLAKQENGQNKFIAPCVFCASPFPGVNTTSSLPGKDKSSSPQKKQRRLALVFLCVPVSPGRSRLIWVFPRNFAVWLDRVVPRWMYHLGQNLILDSDLYLLHLEEHKIAAVGPSNWQKACFVPTKADALVIGFRKWLRKYSNGQVDWGNVSTTSLLPTPPKEQLMDRYWTNVVQCRSCYGALRGLKVLEVVLQVMAISSIGIVAVSRHNMSTVMKSAIVLAAVACFVASRWLSHFIYKNFYFHDYNHALK